MNYDETIEYLYAQLPVYQRQGATAIKKDLTNTRLLCEHLGNPQEKIMTIHVAGTNGKGTVSHLIAAMLQTMGLRVGLYTSPHYTDFRERMKINGEWILEAEVIDFVGAHRDYIERLSPSFFELTVCMAFDYFARHEVDIAVIETGLGGRLDSTNVITPELSVITHISLDHVDMLGDTIYAIAGEKAGIIKPQVPAVIGRHQTDCDHVFWAKSRDCDSAITYADHQWEYRSGSLIGAGNQCIELPADIDAESPFMIENCITAVEAISQYCNLNSIDLPDISRAITDYRKLTKYIGRWQLLCQSPKIITDSAHNPDALRKVIDRLLAEDYDQLHMVLGFVSDKDVNKIMSFLPQDTSYYWVQPSIFRAKKSEEVMSVAHATGLSGDAYATVESGVRAALSKAGANDLIYVGGSSFVVADVLGLKLDDI